MINDGLHGTINEIKIQYITIPGTADYIPTHTVYVCTRLKMITENYIPTHTVYVCTRLKMIT
jgi:hypothetical protein